MAKELKKITGGRVRDRGVTWFPELVDKSEKKCMICYVCVVTWVWCALLGN